MRSLKMGHVLSLRVDQGFASAEVHDIRPGPYKVEVALPMFTTRQWRRVTDALLKKAYFTAKLLAGDMPLEIEKIFSEANADLLPTSEADLSSDCPCLDRDDPCKHVSAVYVALAQEIERNPFLLMEMRGLSRAQLLAEIQARRSPAPVAVPKGVTGPRQTPLAHRLHDFFNAPKEAVFVWPVDTKAIEERLKPGGRIHEMGSPPFWQSDNDFEDVLTRIYKAVRKHVSQ